MIVRQINSHARRCANVEGRVDILVDDDDLWDHSQNGTCYVGQVQSNSQLTLD